MYSKSVSFLRLPSGKRLDSDSRLLFALAHPSSPPRRLSTEQHEACAIPTRSLEYGGGQIVGEGGDANSIPGRKTTSSPFDSVMTHQEAKNEK